jgi:hypothetical protein
MTKYFITFSGTIMVLIPLLTIMYAQCFTDSTIFGGYYGFTLTAVCVINVFLLGTLVSEEE